MTHFTNTAMDNDCSLLHALDVHQSKFLHYVEKAMDDTKFYCSKALDLEDDLIEL
jgi:hypothetical protein